MAAAEHRRSPAAKDIHHPDLAELVEVCHTRPAVGPVGVGHIAVVHSYLVGYMRLALVAVARIEVVHHMLAAARRTVEADLHTLAAARRTVGADHCTVAAVLRTAEVLQSCFAADPGSFRPCCRKTNQSSQAGA